MAIEVLVPQMGESVLEGTILEWKVKVGDKIEINQPLVELMTDKVNVEIPAEVAGVLTQRLVKEGDVVPVGMAIAVIDDGSGATVTTTPKSAAKPRVEQADAPARIDAPVAAASTSMTATPTAAVGRGKMSPKVKMMVRQYSVDPSTIVPTGKEGRVTIDDILKVVGQRSQTAGFASVASLPPAAQSAKAPSVQTQKAAPTVRVDIPVFAPQPSDQRERCEPLTGVRKLIAEHMVKSVRTSPHVTTFEDVDLTDLVAYRNSIKADFIATYGANITFMPFIVKAVCMGLKEFPKLNASITETEIVYKSFYNIGIAVAREDGLIVPVIKDADKKSIIELAVEIASLGEKSRTNRLMPDDVSGGTFSLTNAGMFGAGSSTPIINQPQVAILGIHAIIKKPWVVDDKVVVRDISNFGLSFDHRLIDGHVAVQFLHRVHQYLADMKQLLLHLR